MQSQKHEFNVATVISRMCQQILQKNTNVLSILAVLHVGTVFSYQEIYRSVMFLVQWTKSVSFLSEIWFETNVNDDNEAKLNSS